MMAVVYLLAMLLLFSLSIFVHELGHFLAARAFGMIAEVFSIGMGPALWKRQIGATRYQIGAIPFGGFVALPQMDPHTLLERTSVNTDSPPGGSPAPARPLPPVAPWKKIVVALAGSAGNLLFALLLAAIVWVVGKPSSLQEENAVVGFVAADSPAHAAGLRPGDEILAIHGRPVHNWLELLQEIALEPGETVRILVRAPSGQERELAIPIEISGFGLRTLPGVEGMDPCHVAAVYPGSGAEAAGLRPGDQILRFDGQTVFSRAHLSQLVEAAAGRPAPIEFRRGSAFLHAQVESRYDETLSRHLIGVQFNTFADFDFTSRSHPTPWAQIKSHAGAIFSFLRALTTPATSGSAASAVGGPVLILMMLWLLLQSSFILAVWFTGFLNVNLAIINLLPLPILDGGHVVFNLWEVLFRRPAPPRLVSALANLFATLFLVLFLLLTFRDSVRHLLPAFQNRLRPPPPAPAIFDE